MEGPKSTTPNVIRAACRARFYDSIDVLTAIAWDETARDGDRIKAVEALGRFGIGAADQAAVHLHAGAGSQVFAVVALPALGEGAADGALEEATPHVSVGDVTPHVPVPAHDVALQLEPADGEQQRAGDAHDVASAEGGGGGGTSAATPASHAGV